MHCLVVGEASRYLSDFVEWFSLLGGQEMLLVKMEENCSLLEVEGRICVLNDVSTPRECALIWLGLKIEGVTRARERVKSFTNLAATPVRKIIDERGQATPWKTSIVRRVQI